MNDTIIDIKAISELTKLGFFIPSYQRGYRWTSKQVKDLLNDIADFSPKQNNNSSKESWYCLQPLVVKQMDSSLCQKHQLDNSRTWFEVIDGQQRLTTIYLIGHYINEMWRGKDKDPEILLNFETREASSSFLRDLVIDEKPVDKNTESNIDFFHISEAYKAIYEWVKNSENPNFNKDTFIGKFLTNTKVIWYETTEDDAISIFTRINMGKIPLTNAELVKALFLNSSNFTDTASEDTLSKKREIASEWDAIEATLQNDNFWYFINSNENKTPTRIEFILDLMADKPDDAHEYYTFKYFNKKFKTHSGAERRQNWEEIKHMYQNIYDWYTDRELYHKIGYLISVDAKTKIKDLLEAANSSSKNDFKQSLNEKIGLNIPKDIDALEYKNSPAVKRVLLLHNIQSMLDNRLETSRFPFERFKVENWDVEHIHAVNEELPKTDKHRTDWLQEAKDFIGDTQLITDIEKYDNKDFEGLAKKILNYFSEKNHHVEINDISNLALLDSTTNRGYGNAVFPVKRRKIIAKDANGTFIPLCTKNVFLKYYSSEVGQMTFWGEQDRSYYLENIKAVLNPYLN